MERANPPRHPPHPTPRRHGVASRRALTLIEVLAAIAVIVVLSAVAMPLLSGRVAAARFDTAARRVETAVVMARAEAQRRGETMRLVARDSAGGQRLVLAPFGDTGSEESPGEGSVHTETILAEELGSGVRLAQGSATGAEANTVLTAGLPQARAPEFLIATFLPDGTVTPGGVIHLAAGKRTLEVRLNSWTGAATLMPVAASEETGEAEGGGEKTEGT